MISPSMDRDVLYQVSAMDLLMNGSYGGITSAKDLKAHGDFGIGTFEGLDGEMIVLDGTVYQARSDGVVRAMDDSASIPFAEVTYFDADRNIALSGHYNYSTITAAIDEKLPSKNDFYAVRIHTTFTYLKVRSPPAQHEPYPALSEALKNQSVFELNNVPGTIVGYYTPAYARGIGSPGFHFHFISDDHKSGGHVLDLGADDAIVVLDETPRFSVVMSP
jgi:acetolactate decarboxylase